MEFKKINKEKKRLEYIKVKIDNLLNNLKDINILLNFSNNDEQFFLEINSELNSLKKELCLLELHRYFSNKHDKLNCYVSIQSGSGGIEAQDWSKMLLRMYLRWSELHQFKTKIIEESKNSLFGIKFVTFRVIGNYAYGWLRTENGIHRLIRKSPFDSGHRRHTSFSSVVIYPDINNFVNIIINPNDLRIDVYRSSGAGGQHVNTTESAVRITHLPTNTVVICQNSRSQHKNKNTALKQLKSKLYELEMEKKKILNCKFKETQSSIGWGNHIRSYILDNNLIKDLRTGVEINNTKKILDGYIDKFIIESLKLGI